MGEAVDSTKQPKPARKAVRDNKEHRHSMRMYSDDYEMLVYWAQQYGMDRTEFLITAMHHYIKHRNQDFDLPTAEIQRLNQLIDAMNNMATNQRNLETTVQNGLDSLLGIIRGENYLVEPEQGEL